MLLTITSTAEDATDLGYLLHKNPARAQRFDVTAGVAHVVYPEAEPDRCTVALLLDVDPVALVRDRRFGADGFALWQYVNDRPYAGGSLLAAALGKVFSTALAGRCAGHEELIEQQLPLSIRVPSLPCDGGPELIREMFEPLGWSVSAVTVPHDPEVPRWGAAPYVDLTLVGHHRVQAALSHLFVLLPTLDPARRFWTGPEAVDKLIRTAGGWLAGHPARDRITRRYLRGRPALLTDATERLEALDGGPSSDGPSPEGVDPADEDGAAPAVARRPLAALRKEAVLAALRDVGAHRVVDLGCGEGVLVRELVRDPAITEILAVDVSARALQVAARRLNPDRLSDTQRDKVRWKHSSASYRDDELAGWDAVVLMEVVEHVEPERLDTLERHVFAHARPASVVLTTPNAEHNVLYGLAAHERRHPDHRFEWTRAELQSWAQRVADEHGYAVTFRGVGDPDATHGPPTQLALFRRVDAGDALAAVPA